MKLRASQPSFVDKAVEILESPSTKKCVMVAPVAYGKSLCIAATAHRLKYPLIVLQPNKELLQQNYLKYISYGNEASICSNSMKDFIKKGIPYSRIGGKEIPCMEIGDVTFATPGTIKSMIDEVLRKKVKYVIIDECHYNTASKSVLKSFLDKVKIKNILGVTATPVMLYNTVNGATLKMINSSKHNMFSTISHIVQIQEMLEGKYWSELVYDVKIIDNSRLQFNSTGSDYTDASMKLVYDENKTEQLCIDNIKDLRKEGRKSILVFVPSVREAIDLSRKVKGSAVIHGNIDKKLRSEILENFKALKIDVVINVEILTTGFDHPQLDAIIMARPTASMAMYYQILGRITRIHPLKSNGRIVDLSGNVCRFGKIESLNYEYIEGYGWGMFSDDKLLTDHPFSSQDTPTKELLRKYSSLEGIKSMKQHSSVVIWFGKHEGKELQFIPKDYLAFLLNTLDFNTKNMKSFKNSIETILKLK